MNDSSDNVDLHNAVVSVLSSSYVYLLLLLL